MSDNVRQLHLNLFGPWYGGHGAAWRHPSVDPRQPWDLDFNLKLAKAAERALFDAVFLADGPSMGEVSPSGGQTRPEPITVLSAIVAATEYLGVAATMSTTYSEPYNTARQIASLDLLSGGRVGWNAVTGSQASAASNFSAKAHPEAAHRYARGEEFIEIVKALWESWEPDAVIADQKTGVFLDPSKVHRVPFAGEHFQVDALFNVPRSPQGRPVLFHAGSSERGRNQAARHADAVFAAQPSLEGARLFYADIKQRATRFGRDADSIKIFPGYLPIIGSTEAEARANFAELNQYIDIDGAIARTKKTLQLDLSQANLDKPVPEDVWRAAANSPFSSRVAVIHEEAIAKKQTAREVAESVVSAFGHHLFVGTPEQVADDIELWFTTGAADGFNYKLAVVPDSLEVFTAHVLPLLQAKGIYRREYGEKTLRGHLGLDTPALAPAR